MRDAGRRTGSGHAAVAGGAGVPAAELHLRAGLSDRGQRRPGPARRSAWAAVRGADRRGARRARSPICRASAAGAAWVLAEIVVVVALMLSTEFVASDQWALDNQSWPTTLWATNATISAAILSGPIARDARRCGGDDRQHGREGLHQLSTSAATPPSSSNSRSGLAVGMAAQTARRAHAELERAARLAASLEERERLSRQVHDGAIQVLALVSRRGREIGGETAELAELAGEQERALRRLVSSADAEPPGGRRRPTWARCCGGARRDRVSVSVPADPVLLDAGGRRRAVMRRWPTRWTTSPRTPGRMPAPTCCSRTSATR